MAIPAEIGIPINIYREIKNSKALNETSDLVKADIYIGLNCKRGLISKPINDYGMITVHKLWKGYCNAILDRTFLTTLIVYYGQFGESKKNYSREVRDIFDAIESKDGQWMIGLSKYIFGDKLISLSEAYWFVNLIGEAKDPFIIRKIVEYGESLKSRES